MPGGDDPYLRENFQRNCMLRGLKSASEEDVIIISDLDEIPNLENKPYKIDIHINNPLSPLELLQSADGRLLGILVESIEII